MLAGSFSEPSDSPTSFICVILFTGYRSGRESNTNYRCFALGSSLNQGPIYLSDLLHLYSLPPPPPPPRQALSSANSRMFGIPSFRTKSSGQRSFFYRVPTTRNQFQLPGTNSLSLSSCYLSLFFQIFYEKLSLFKNSSSSPIAR